MSGALRIITCLLFLLGPLPLQSKKSRPNSSSSQGKNSEFVELDESENALESFIAENEVCGIYFYDKQNIKSTRALTKLEKSNLGPLLPLAKIDNDEEALAYGLKVGQLPSLFMFENGIPEEYPGTLEETGDVMKWIREELDNKDVEIIDADMLEKVVDTGNAILALFLKSDSKVFPGEVDIYRVAERFDINLVKIQNEKAASNKYGIDEFPAVIYFERGLPTIYEDSVRSLETLSEWIEFQRSSDTIEEVSDEILQALIVDQEYLAVFFTGPCDERASTDQECERVLRDLENIDDELDEYGITLVTTEDILYAGNVLKIRKFPALGIFRNGEFLLYKGKLGNERDLLNWLLDKETLEIPGRIEEVGRTMLMKLIEEESDLVAFLYDDDSSENRKKAEEIIKYLENIDDKLEKNDIEFVKCSDDGIAEDLGFFEQMPILLYFENGIPVAFDGEDLKDEGEIYKWSVEQYETNEIPSVDLNVLQNVIERIDNLLVIFYDPNKRRHTSLLGEIETTDDDAEKLDIFMVKVGDVSVAKSFGIYTLPALIYYENKIPNVYDEDLTSDEMLRWLENQRSGSHIEKVTGLLLDGLIKEVEYVGVLFMSDCEKNEDECDYALKDLEKIDEELDALGIAFVYTDDTQYASSKLRLNTFPTICFFRNRNKIIYQGSISNEIAILKFFTTLENIIIPNEIEDVSVKLLIHLTQIQSSVFAFLYKEDHQRALNLLEDYESSLDQEMEKENALLVKCSDENVEKEFGIGFLPRLIHFKRRVPIAFQGDETDTQAVFEWMKESIREELIPMVTKSILEQMIEREESIGVFFVDDENKQEMTIIKELDKVYNKIVEDELMLVMIDDANLAEELGLEDPPTLVHFSGDIPSIYRGEENVRDILAWLDKLKIEFIIEEITPKILEDLIETKEYVAILFKGQTNSDKVQEVYARLENIDDDLQSMGITFVQISDEEYPYNEHGITHFPTIGLYRNTVFKQIEGIELEEENELHKWFLDPNNLYLPGQIETVNNEMLSFIYEHDDNFAVLFFDKDDRNADDIIEKLELVDSEMDAINITFVKIYEDGAEEDYGIIGTPNIAYIREGIPNIYEGELEDEKAFVTWIKEESTTIRILEVSVILFRKLLDKFENIVVVFFDMEEDPTVDGLHEIGKECQDNDIALVKIKDQEECQKLGIQSLDMPQLVYFHKKIPSLMMNVNVEKSQDVLEWLIKQKTTSIIERLTDEILEQLIEEHEYVAVYFSGACNAPEGPDCESVLAKLETIDDDLDETGILMVTTSDTRVASEKGLQDLPGIGFFRNTHFLPYEGDESNEKAIFKWLTNEETLKIIGVIDDVNTAMLENILEDEDHAFVFFYESNDTDAHTILEELEYIDEKLDQQDLTFVKISDPGSAQAFGIEEVPSLVFFENGVPELYDGNFLNDKSIIKWIKSELQENEIKEITKAMLDVLVEKEKNMAIVFYDPNDNVDYTVVDEMEKIRISCEKYGIDLLKLKDIEEAKRYGILELPGLLYFEKRVPSLYDGVLEDEEILLEWLITQKMTDTIEEVTEQILESLVKEEEYLGVFFSGPCDDGNDEDQCNLILEELEKIDTLLENHGIMLVTTENRDIAKQYDIRSFPSIALFRNGEPLIFEGDLNEKLAILDWMTDKKNLMLPGKIEKVNNDFLQHLLNTESHVLVAFYREGNLQDEQFIDILEKIDDDLEEKRLNLIKCSDKGIEKRFGLSGLPLLVHFNNKVPNVLTEKSPQPKEMLEWMLNSMKKQEIEEVNGPVLDYLKEDLDNLAVIFVNGDSGDFLDGMEQMDDELDSICVPMVKVLDLSKALEFGIEEFPTLVYFKDKIPGLFDGDKSNFKDIFSWISTHKKDNVMQLVSDTILRDNVEDLDFPYVAVLFQGHCKDPNCKQKIQEVVEGVETINDEVENLGITLITSKDKRAAKIDFGVTSFPSLIFFKNGLEDHVLYTGDLTDKASLYNWLSDTDNIQIPGKMESVNGELLEHIIDSEDDVFVYFYNEREAKPIDENEVLKALEKVDDNLENDGVQFIMVAEDKENVIEEYGLTLVPSLVYFDSGIPSAFPGDLENYDSILGWTTKILSEQNIIEANRAILESLLKRNTYVAALYYNEKQVFDNTVLKSLEEIDGELKDNDINIVKISDARSFTDLGTDGDTPILVYYENEIPSLYPNVLEEDVTALFQWLVEQRNTASIEFVTDEMLNELIEEEDYVAVLFMGTCVGDDEEEECRKILADMENIDHVLDEHGIAFVATNDTAKAKEHWISRFPALALYRNGDYLKYNLGELTEEETVLKWLTSDKTLSIPGQIEEVNEIMLNKILSKSEANAFVLFYEEEDMFAQRILKELEELDGDLEASGIKFLKISDKDIEENYDFDDLPALVHFKEGEMREFFGNIREMSTVVEWIHEESADRKKLKLKKKGKKKKQSR
uniref:Putative LOC100161052 [Acyrthosiphon pisum] n=1 Tax=Lepeophtheirus salmonis TaxID=72036 RepID=A0A0K2UHY0_LEPSM